MMNIAKESGESCDDDEREQPKLKVTAMNETGIQISAWINKAWLREALPGIAAMVDAALMK